MNLTEKKGRLDNVSRFSNILGTSFSVGFNRALSHNAETKDFARPTSPLGQKQSFLFPWDLKWPPRDKGLLTANYQASLP